MSKVDIDIDRYLTEEDKVEIARNLFTEQLRKGFLENQSHKRIDNYERVINNSVYHFLSHEIDSILSTDTKEYLRVKVQEILNKDLQYTVFRNPSLWGDKKSVAQEMLDTLVVENKEIAEQKVKEALENINFSNLDDYLIDVLKEVIVEKLKQ